LKLTPLLSPRSRQWARAGDEVISMFGKGVVKEIRPDGAAVVVVKR